MSDVLAVVMSGRVAGWVRRARGRLAFSYEDTYRESPDATPLSVAMPLQEREHPHGRIAPWLDGLLPDDVAVRQRWARQFHVDASSPFALLSTAVGEDCAGAAQFVTEDRLGSVLSGGGEVEWLTEAQVAQRLRDLHRDRTSWLGEDFTGRFSLAGAQAKVALLHDPGHGRWGVPSGAAATSHILKPAIPGLDDHELNEYLCLRAAAACGLVVAPVQLLRFEDQSVVATPRYDRYDSGSPWPARIHQEDLCQALSRFPGDKYENEGGPTTRQVCALLRDVLPATAAEDAVHRFFDAVTFNWLIAGTDAHAKNYSLLLASTQVRLAPLYDLASALPYPTDIRRLRLAMKYGASYSLRPRTPSMWNKVASEFSLPATGVRQRASELADIIPAAIDTATNEADVTALASELPSRLQERIAKRVATCRTTLT